MTGVVLHQFPYSHFNEKVRWALGYKGIDHRKKGYLPGTHMPAIKKLSGQVQTPVLDWHGKIIVGSAAIIARLEKEVPEPALYPKDQKQREEALSFAKRFDIEVGPATRTILFTALINEGAYMCGMFSTGKPRVTRVLYRMSFPLARGMVAKGNGVNEKNVGLALDVSQKALDEVAEKTHSTGYIVGDQFSIADLTAAALIAPLANPQHPEMARPKPVPDSVQKVLDRYRHHEAITWVNRQYELHRSG